MHILERAQSLSSITSSDTNSPVMTKAEDGADETAQSSPTDYETDSESSDDMGHEGSDAPSKASAQTTPLPRIDTSRQYADASSSSPVSASTRAWYEFDLAVVVALVSPIGNWLTGGDHIKNLFLVILLIFYLHQIIEVPWVLYNASRPRRRPSYLPPDANSEDRYRQIASSELRTVELFFLALTIVSPFIGAALLRLVTSSVAGQDVVSWFSTALFVLATGLRPWRHVVDRLNQRTIDLHDVIHYGPSDSTADDMQKKVEDLLQRVAHLEKTVRKHDRKFEKQEARVKVVEESVETMKSKGKGKPVYVDTTSTPSSIFAYFFPAWLLSPPHRNLYSSQYSPSSAASRYSVRSSSYIRLETILEEGTKLASSPIAGNPVMNLALRTGYFATMPLRAVLGVFARSY